MVMLFIIIGDIQCLKIHASNKFKQLVDSKWVYSHNLVGYFMFHLIRGMVVGCIIALYLFLWIQGPLDAKDTAPS